MKKFLINLLLVIMMVSASFFVGCSCGGDGDGDDSGNNPGTPPSSTATIELKADKRKLIVGEYSKVTAMNYTTVEGVTLVYASSNPNVIRVDSNGNIEAMSNGDALISVTYGEAKAQIRISSSFNELEPELGIDGLYTRNISNEETDQINPYVFFNNRKFGLDEGLTVTYKSSNEQVITVNESGEVSPVAGARGEAIVTLIASWRGKDGDLIPSMQKEILYSVDYNTVFKINNKTAFGYEVYTLDEFEGENYEKVKDFVCTATYGEEEIDSSDITVTIANEDMASYQGGKLTGKSFGTNGRTTARLTFERNGTTYEKIVPITVKRPVATYTDTIKYFSSMTGTFKDENDGFEEKSLADKIFASKEIIDVYQGDVRLSVENGKILGVQSNFDSVAKVNLRIGSATECYDVSVDVYTKVIQNANDIVETFSINKEGKFVTGYCEMVADVDMAGIDYNHEGYSKNNSSSYGGFRGVFNGNGYTINNLKTHNDNPGGMFLYIHDYDGNKSVIKNVAFNNVIIGKSGSVVTLGVTALTQFENIYIKVADDNTGLVKGTVLAGYDETLVKMKNLFIEVPTNVTINPITVENELHIPSGGNAKPTGNTKRGFGSLFSGLGKVTELSNDNFNSVYVVSSMPLTYYEGDDVTYDIANIPNYESDLTLTKINDKQVKRYNPYYYQYGINQNKTWDGKEIPANSTLGSIPNYLNLSVQTGAYYYKTLSDLKDARADLSSFAKDEGEYWVVIDNVPVWRSLDKESYYATENGKLMSDVVVLNDDKIHTTIGVTNYTGVDFAITNAVSNNENVTATVNSGGNSVTLNVINGYTDWDNTKDIEITLTFGNSQTLIVKVRLTSIIGKIDNEVLFSAQDGAFYDNNVVAHSQIVEAFQIDEDSNLKTLTVTKEGYLLGATTNITNGFKDVGYIKIRVLTKDGLWYQFNKVKAYTGILTKGEHLKWFEVESYDDKNQGHYILGNNINALNVGITHIVNNPTSATAYYNQIPSTNAGGFQGIFDGQGYTIDSMFSFRNGLFGRIFNDEQGVTEIKNVAFTNVVLDSLAKELDDGKKHSQGPLFARFTPDTVLEDYVAKYQTVISNVYIQTKVPQVGPAYSGTVFFGIFEEYCEYNIVTDTAEETRVSIPLDKRGSVVSFKLVDCFFDYTNSNEKINERHIGASSGGLIVRHDIGSATVNYNESDTTVNDNPNNDVGYVVSEEIKNSRYDNLFIASKYPISVVRKAKHIPGYPECPNTVLISEFGMSLYVTYASTMAGEAGYKGWKWIPYEVAKADPENYASVLNDAHLPDYMKNNNIDYKICGQMVTYHETITFTGNPTEDNSFDNGTFFYTNINQYGTLDDMASEYASNSNLYSGYDTTYWTVIDGKLAWKSAVA